MRTLILQSLAVLLCSPEVQQFSLAVMELCVGWELIDVGSHKASTRKYFCSVISWRIGAVIQTTTAVDCAADQTGWPGALYIRFHFELRPFIHFWHLQLDRCTPLRGLLALCTEAPPATLEKPGASDLHWLAPLVCSVWPVPLEEESGPITSRRSETNMMSSSRFAITGCRWEGLGLSAALFA